MGLRIAVIPGDGIGNEVMPEGVRVLEKVCQRFGISIAWEWFDWSCETWLKTGHMMPEDGIDQLSRFDAIYLGAVGFPTVPDHISLWGLLIPIRREFQQYVNLRPVRLFDGVSGPLANKKPGDIDFYVVRENCEGEYSDVGGASMRARRMRWSSNNLCSRARVLIELSPMRLSWPKSGTGRSWHRPLSLTGLFIPCRFGMSAWTKSPVRIQTLK